MKLKVIAKTILGMLAVSALPMAEAALLSVDWKTAGDGLLTRDTAAGLEWLDITQTQGKNKSHLSSLTGAGGIAEGFRLATINEFVALYSGAGLVESYSDNSSTAKDINYIESARALQSLIGRVQLIGNPTTLYVSTGFLAETFGASPTSNAFGSIGIAERSLSGGDYSYSYTALTDWTIGSGNYFSGLYLVRDVPIVGSVPEPSSLALLGAGAVGFGFVRRQRKAAKLSVS